MMSMTDCFAGPRTGSANGRIRMTTTQLLMPKATAVWLVDNTSLTFEEIAVFC
jgi:hypothetical protein